MHAKIRQNHQLNVPTALVYAAIEDVDTNGLEYGTGTFREKSKREKASVTSERTSWVFHFDGSVTSERTNWVFHFDGSVTSERTNWVFHFDGSVTSERTNWVFHFDRLE